MENSNKTLALFLPLLFLVSLFAVQLVLAQTVESVFDHFDFDPIGSQAVGVPFNITVWAKDQYNQTFTSYNGTNTWSTMLVVHENLYDAGYGVTGAFVNGFWSGEINLTRAGGTTLIYTEGHGKQGRSNPIGVYDLPATPTPTKTQTPAPSEPPTPSTSHTALPTPTHSVPEFSWLMILPPFIFILSIAVIVRLRKTCRITQH